MVQRASQDAQSKANGVSDAASPYLGSGPEHSMAFDIRDVADIAVPNVSPAEMSAKEANGRNSPFMCKSHGTNTVLEEQVDSERTATSPETWPCESVH